MATAGICGRRPSQVMGGSLATKSVRFAFQIMEELRSRNASGA